MKVVVLTGAGISAESGLKTFRGEGGLWEGHDVTKVATPEAWKRNQALVLKFYNERRRQLNNVLPNIAHISLSKLDNHFNTVVITQNVDDLHERGGSKRIIHLHGELKKVRSVMNPSLIYNWEDDLNVGDLCEDGYQLRPHIVWFGEMVPMLEVAISEVFDAEVAIIIGTSMQVYPAASLINYVPKHCKIFYIDPNPSVSYALNNLSNLTVIPDKATTGVPILIEKILSNKV